MIDHFFGIYWAATNNALWFVLITLLIAILVITGVRTHRFIGRLTHPDHRTLLLQHFSWYRYVIKKIMLSVALLLIGFALLRPQWDAVEETVQHQGRDVIIALDISRSMLAQDYEPHRLEYAKQKIKRLLELLDAERVGLLVFSGAAVVQCPLTTDRQAFLMFLDALSVETISSGTTSYAAALEKMLQTFAHFATDRSKIALLCTDGEDFSQDLTALQAKLADQKIHVCTYGIASSDGAPIPLYDEQLRQQGFQKDEKGQIVISRCNVPLMQRIAHETNGIFVPATHDEVDLQQIKKWITSFEKTSWEEQQVQRLQDKYFYYTGSALILLLLEWLL